MSWGFFQNDMIHNVILNINVNIKSSLVQSSFTMTTNISLLSSIICFFSSIWRLLSSLLLKSMTITLRCWSFYLILCFYNIFWYWNMTFRWNSLTCQVFLARKIVKVRRWHKLLNWIYDVLLLFALTILVRQMFR